MSKLSSSKFWVVVHNAVQMHELLLFCESSYAAANNANLGKKKFDMFYKIDCCAVIHGRIWMNKSSRIIMPIMHWNKFCYIFLNFEKFGVNPDFLSFKLTLYTVVVTQRNVISKHNIIYVNRVYQTTDTIWEEL